LVPFVVLINPEGQKPPFSIRMAVWARRGTRLRASR
jgi:hypothetical protein